MQPSDRVRAALASRSEVGEDFFGGWEDEDVELLSRWAAEPGKLRFEPGYLVDWLGCRTDLGNYLQLNLPESGGLLVSDIPIPHDTVHADAIEYVALLTAVEQALARGRRTFAMLELGASYAPWAVHAGLIGRRAGFERIVLRAVEASATAIDRIHEHARVNGLGDDPQVEFVAQHAAVTAKRGSAYFPVVDTRYDNAAQASPRRQRNDYRGQQVDHVKVPAVTLADLASDLDRADFVHLDLQGGEAPLLRDRRTVACLGSKVACVMLATHSRAIEGLALEVLSGAGWELLRERPTGFRQSTGTRDVTGWTTHDGAQLWRNPRFD